MSQSSSVFKKNPTCHQLIAALKTLVVLNYGCGYL